MLTDMKIYLSSSKKYIIVSMIIWIIGGTFFAIANWHTVKPLPKSPIFVGAGPHPPSEILSTNVTFSLPSRYVDVKVNMRFNISQPNTNYIYVSMPFIVKRASPYLIYQFYLIENLTSNYGVLSSSFYNNSTFGFSIANATFQPNATHLYLRSFDYMVDFTLGITIHVDSDFVVSGDLIGTKRTAILTFFGPNSLVYGDVQTRPYRLGRNPRLAIKYPFSVAVKLPVSAALSPETYPAPFQYYLGEVGVWTHFRLEFPGKNLAQTISLTFFYPDRQWIPTTMTFIGGITVSIGASLFMVPLKKRTERRDIGKKY